MFTAYFQPGCRFANLQLNCQLTSNEADSADSDVCGHNRCRIYIIFIAIYIFFVAIYIFFVAIYIFFIAIYIYIFFVAVYIFSLAYIYS